MFLFLITGSLFFSIVSTKGDFIVFFGCSCLGSTGLSTSKFIFAISSFSLSTSLITTHQCLPVRISIFLFYKSVNLSGGIMKPVKLAKFFGNI